MLGEGPKGGKRLFIEGVLVSDSGSELKNRTGFNPGVYGTPEERSEGKIKTPDLFLNPSHVSPRLRLNLGRTESR